MDDYLDHEDNDRRNAAAEAARALANATDGLRVAGELGRLESGRGEERPFRARGVPGLRAAVLGTACSLAALVQVASKP